MCARVCIIVGLCIVSCFVEYSWKYQGQCHKFATSPYDRRLQYLNVSSLNVPEVAFCLQSSIE